MRITIEVEQEADTRPDRPADIHDMVVGIKAHAGRDSAIEVTTGSGITYVLLASESVVFKLRQTGMT